MAASRCRAVYGRTVERLSSRGELRQTSGSSNIKARGSSSAAAIMDKSPSSTSSMTDAGDYVDNPVYHSAAPFIPEDSANHPSQSQQHHRLPSIPWNTTAAPYSRLQEDVSRRLPPPLPPPTPSYMARQLQGHDRVALPEPNSEDPAPWQHQHLTLRKLVQRRTVADNIALVDACLAAQAYDRAHHIVKDIMGVVNATTAVAIYNNYLLGLVSSLKQGISWEELVERFRAMQDVFGLVPDATTYAVMCKGVLVAIEDASWRTTLIQQYAREYRGHGRQHLRPLHDLLLPKTVFQDQQITELMAALGLTLATIPVEKRTLLEDIVMDDHLKPKSKLAEFPELVSVDTRNLGHLKKSLETLTDIESGGSVAYDPTIYLSREMQRQAKLERDTMQSAVDKWKEARQDEHERGEPNVSGLRKIIWHWHEQLVESLKEELKIVTDPKRDVNLSYVQMIMRLLPVERLSSVTILEVMRLNSSGGIAMGMKIARAVTMVGQAIEQEYIAQKLASRDSMALFGKYQRMQDVFSNGRKFTLAKRRLEAAEIARAEADTAPILATGWTQQCHIQVGSRLIMHLIKTAKIESKAIDPETGKEVSQIAPAFYQSFQFLKGKKFGVIRFNSSLVQKLLKEPMDGALPTKASPMLVPPKPWVHPESGGYFFTSEDFMRTNHSQEQLAHLLEAHRKKSLELVYRGLDALGLTCWRINERMYRIMAEIWNNGVGIGKLPGAIMNEDPPSKPTDLNDIDALSQWRKQMKWFAQNYQSLFSMRCTANYKLEIARSVCLKVGC